MSKHQATRFGGARVSVRGKRAGLSGIGGAGGGEPPRRPSRFPESLLILSADDDLIDWLKRILGQIIIFQQTLDNLSISEEFIMYLASRLNVFFHDWITRGKLHAKNSGGVSDAEGFLPLTDQDLRYGLATMLGIHTLPEVQQAIIRVKPARHGEPQDMDDSSAIDLALGLPFLPRPELSLESSPTEVGFSRTRVRPKTWSLSERSFRKLPPENSKLARDLEAVGVVGSSNHPPMMTMERLFRSLWCRSDDILWFAAAAQFLVRRIILSIDQQRRDVGSRSYQHLTAQHLQCFIDELPPDLRQILQLLEVRPQFLSRQEFRASAQAIEISSTEEDDPQQPAKRQRHE